MSRIGERIKTLRELRGLTATKLAELTCLDLTQISKIENNKSLPSLSALERICKALDITLAEFFKDMSEEESPPKEVEKLILEAKKLTDKQIKALLTLIEAFKTED